MPANSVVAILQARMGSTRLPGKVLMSVLGKPLLEYEFERLQRCHRVSRIVLATSTAPADDPVAGLGARLGASVFRGSEVDVLDRYYQAALLVGAKHVMRVTGDCPLLDPALCDQVVEAYFQTGADYLATSPRHPEGLDCEVLSFAALEAAWRRSTATAEREHVTLFVRQRPEEFSVRELDAEEDLGHYRLTVDEPEDFWVVEQVLEHFQGDVRITFAQVRAFLDAHPEVLRHNAGIIRNEGLLKSLAAEEKDA